MSANSFNETFDMFIRVSHQASEKASKDPKGPIGPFKNCFVCSVPRGGKHLKGNEGWPVACYHYPYLL